MSEALASDFGPRLRELREAAGWTQAQLAERAGLHAQGVVKLERGEREPAWSTLLALAAALGVSVAAFAEKPTTRYVIRGPGRPPKARAPAEAPATRARRRGRAGKGG
jgi:transcriptional regulator with XRE-family HTH domain